MKTTSARFISALLPRAHLQGKDFGEYVIFLPSLSNKARALVSCRRGTGNIISIVLQNATDVCPEFYTTQAVNISDSDVMIVD
ncbi:MAG TPA: hypothetical protein VGJ20_38300 [Xanthobacteraceae bacterium]